MNRSNNPKKFLTEKETELVANAIKEAETQTSAEIKLVIARHCWADIKRKAAHIFKKSGLDKTKQRNCVLILLITTNREFLIYGDQGIHEKVGQDFWEDTTVQMTNKFKAGAFGDGICEGIKVIGNKLAYYFPYQAGDKNEISDEVAYED